MLGLIRRERVAYIKMLYRTKLESIEKVLTRAQLRRSGYTSKMSDDRLLKRVLHERLSMITKLSHGQRKLQGPAQTVHEKLISKPPQKNKEDSLDRTGWRAAFFEGLGQFESTHGTERELSRQRRHAALQAPPPVNNPQFRCPECGREC